MRVDSGESESTVRFARRKNVSLSVVESEKTGID